MGTGPAARSSYSSPADAFESGYALVTTYTERPRSTMQRPSEPAAAPRTSSIESDSTAAPTSGLVEDLYSAVEASSTPSASKRLDEALAALKALIVREDADDAAWMHAARLLRGAALERRYSAPRVASVALLIGDALAFTDHDTIAIAERGPLRTALNTLMQSFVSTDDERALIGDLIANRWYVTPAFDPEQFGVAAA